MKTFQNLKSNFAEKDIFNIDESGIFFNLFPNRTLDYKGKNCHGGEKSKQRITAVFAVNADGSQKLPVWIIGKYEKPRPFKNIKELPCKYTHQKNAWVDAVAFRKWLLSFNTRMAAQHRHVLLTMDNCSAHNVKNLEMSNVTICFFPATTTSSLQPLDQGIIALVKKNFRKRLVQAAIQSIESGKEIKKWNILDAVRAIAIAWNLVPANHIQNCFAKAWNQNTEPLVEVNIDETTTEEWDTFISKYNNSQVCTL